jgi:hypothetical protein
MSSRHLGIRATMSKRILTLMVDNRVLSIISYLKEGSVARYEIQMNGKKI